MERRDLDLLSRRDCSGRRSARPDLVVAVDTDGDDIAPRRSRPLPWPGALPEPAPRARPRTLGSAIRRLPEANLATISVPGAYAKLEAMAALRRGLHVFLFSDNVPLADEIALKRVATEKGLLCMGPDCGTGYLSGVGLGFANVVPRGRIGCVSASGTGLQAVASGLASLGEGISHGIGVGGRDLSPRWAPDDRCSLEVLGAGRGRMIAVSTASPERPRGATPRWGAASRCGVRSDCRRARGRFRALGVDARRRPRPRRRWPADVDEPALADPSRAAAARSIRDGRAARRPQIWVSHGHARPRRGRCRSGTFAG
jgi:hypothetical protein